MRQQHVSAIDPSTLALPQVIFGLSIKWLILSIITLDIYTFWVYPRLMRWQVEKNVFAKTG